jgi:general secretion pathway protein A
MYNDHFGFSEAPFSIAPDPRYLYMSEQHREALAHLIFGFNSDGGFVLLTGEVGTGKTTVCRCLLEQVPENAAIAFIFNPKLTVEELLATICDEFGIKYPDGNSSIKVFVDSINSFLLASHAEGRKTVLIIDEAQNLSADVLEQLRLLTNLETNQQKLLQIILLGQPELRDKLASQELRQLSQRIIARYHLGALSKSDVNSYVRHRLSVSGTKEQLFSDSAINKLYQLTDGVPRLINVICDRALLGAFAQERSDVSKSILKKAAGEVLGELKIHRHSSFSKAAIWVSLLLVLVIFGVVLATTYYKTEPLNDNKLNKSELIVPEPIVPVTAMPEPILHDNLQWPDNIPIVNSTEMTFQTLFTQWNISYNQGDSDSMCKFAKTNGLNCLHKKGNLRSLLLLNRPAALQLFNDQGQSYYIAMTSVTEDTATVIIGSESIVIPVSLIESHWFGDYIILWRPPPDYPGPIRSGHSGAVVQWLDNQLAVLNDRPLSLLDNPTYGIQLETEVKKFQAFKGLIPDGIVGAHTIIRLNTATDYDVPKLFSRYEEN